MKDSKLSKEEIRELEEMARIGKEAFPGELSDIEKTLGNRIDTRLTDEQNAPSANNRTRWKITVLLLMAIAFLAYLSIKPRANVLSQDQYAIAYYETPPFVISESSRDLSKTSALLSGVGDAYKQKNFSKVLLLASDHEDNNLTFYQGIALLELGRIDEAVAILEQHATDDLEDMRSWYLALGLLESDDKPAAMQLLEKITDNPTHYKIGEALKLIEELRGNN